MRAIGFRADPNSVFWAVVEKTDAGLILIASSKDAAPKTYSESESLAWIRSHVRALIDLHKPSVAAVRFPEPSAQRGKPTSVHRRSRIEGVLLEAAQSKKLPVTTGSLATINAKLATKSAKAYLETDRFREIDWSSIKDNRREAILVASAALGS